MAIPSDDAETLTDVTDVWLPSNNSCCTIVVQFVPATFCSEDLDNLRKGINCFSTVFAISDGHIVPPLSNSSANTMKGVGSMCKTEVDTLVCILCSPHTSSLPRSVLKLQASPKMYISSTLTCAEQMPLITI